MKWTRKLGQNVVRRLNNLPIRRKLGFLFLICMLLPLVVTDSLILHMLVTYQRDTIRHDTANAVSYYLKSEVDSAVDIANNLYLNRYINEFLNAPYDSPLDYYLANLEMLQNSLLESSLSISTAAVTMYADNPTIINGGRFQQLAAAQASTWYKKLEESGSDMILYAYYDASSYDLNQRKRCVSLIRRMNYYRSDPCEKLVKVDLDYSAISMGLRTVNTEADFYVCAGDQVIFTDVNTAGMQQPYRPLPAEVKPEKTFSQSLSLYGTVVTIYVVNHHTDLLAFFLKNRLMILMMLLFNLLLPTLMIHWLNRSFVDRLQTLSQTFQMANTSRMMEVSATPEESGGDEIAVLMRNYNHMACRTNRLIDTVYKSKLREQETNLARKNAELLALRSQINPHFLFNALESIRMRSVLKSEKETAEMIAQLALLERQYVDWSASAISITEELNYVQGYLRLQKYRFGDRFSYRVDCDPAAARTGIPKLTLLTFVENACLHGISGKAGHGWIFVRVLRREKVVRLEIEDTGVGMTEEKRCRLEEKMNHASLDMLKTQEHIGVVNACLRLTLATDQAAAFALDSEPGVGTTVVITLPAETDEKKSEKEDIDASGIAGR